MLCILNNRSLPPTPLQSLQLYSHGRHGGNTWRKCSHSSSSSESYQKMRNCTTWREGKHLWKNGSIFSLNNYESVLHLSIHFLCYYFSFVLPACLIPLITHMSSYSNWLALFYSPSKKRKQTGWFATLIFYHLLKQQDKRIANQSSGFPVTICQ